MSTARGDWFGLSPGHDDMWIKYRNEGGYPRMQRVDRMTGDENGYQAPHYARRCDLCKTSGAVHRSELIAMIASARARAALADGGLGI